MMMMNILLWSNDGDYHRDDDYDVVDHKSFIEPFINLFFYFILFSCFICSLLLQLGYTAIIWASRNYELDIVCALLKFQANANAKNNVRNQLIRIYMMMSNDEDRYDCR
jgi:hypothetical protein